MPNYLGAAPSVHTGCDDMLYGYLYSIHKLLAKPRVSPLKFGISKKVTHA